MKWRYYNVSDSFSVDIGQFISDRGIAISDITSAIYMAKTARGDADASALATLTLGGGITAVPASGVAPDKLAFQFSGSDFGVGKLEVTSASSSPLYTGIGIKTSGMTSYLEIDLVDDRLTIVSDFIHD